MKSSSDKGIVDVPSNHTVDETVAKLEEILAAKGVTLFALVDHSGEAEKAGLKMPATKLLIFGSPKAGTSLMLASPTHSDRSSAEDFGVGGRGWEGVDLLQQRRHI